jgi:hypothetical protein
VRTKGHNDLEHVISVYIPTHPFLRPALLPLSQFLRSNATGSNPIVPGASVMASCVYRKTEGPVALPNGGKEGGKWEKEKREDGSRGRAEANKL